MPSEHPSVPASTTTRSRAKGGVSLASLIALLSYVLVAPGLAARTTTNLQTPTDARQRPAATPALFAPNSIWNQALPRNASLDPASRPIVKELAHEAQTEFANGIGPWVSTDNYSTTVYSVPARRRTVRVALDQPTGARAALQAAFARVPIPAGAVPAGGTDAVMTIYQPGRDRLWEFWKARRSGTAWHASWGGAIEHVSSSPGYYTRSSWPRAAPNWGAGGASFPMVGGLMRISELRTGHIDHALSMALPNPRGGVLAWPAQRTDGTNSDKYSLPEGAHLRLDPRLDVAALRLPPITRMIALAAQRYGIVVTNRTNSSLNFDAEDPSAYGAPSYSSGGPSPYYGPGGLFDGLWPAAFLHEFPWKSLQVLRMRLRAGV